MKRGKKMTPKEKEILRFEYWKLLVAQSANIDEFGQKNQNIEQRKLELQNVFWALGFGVPIYDDMEYMIKDQTWRFNIDEHGSHYYTYINKDGSVGYAVKNIPDDLRKFVDKKGNCIR